MALKIRCQECQKKISIDEAFAGGVCRCPYCKALTMVPGGAESSAPTARPDRPQAPSATVAAPAPAPEHVPVARPVLVQGVVAIVGACLLLLMGLAVVMVVLVARKMTQGGGSGAMTWNEAVAVEDEKNPFKLPGVQVAGEPLTTPAVFVLDASAAMRDWFDLYRAILRRSVLTFKSEDLFNVYVVREEGVVKMQTSPAPGREEGERKAGNFLREIDPFGATDITSGIEQAFDSGAKTVVIMGNREAGRVDPLIQKAKARGVRVFVILVGKMATWDEDAKKLCEASGGKFVRFLDRQDLERWNDAMPSLD